MVVKKPELIDGELIPSCFTPVKLDAVKLLNSGNGMWKYARPGAASFCVGCSLVYFFCILLEVPLFQSEAFWSRAPVLLVNKDILKTIPCNTKNSQTNHAPRFECSLSSEKVSQKVVDICMLYKNKQATRVEKAKHTQTSYFSTDYILLNYFMQVYRLNI
jgi:hypothetical protein